jgi:hypothetical protein
MAKRAIRDLAVDEFDGCGMAPPVRMHRTKRRLMRGVTRRRKVASPPGIHRRANKKISW